VTRLKQVFGLAGFLVTLAGIALESRGLVWAAMGLLAVSLLLRIIVRFRNSGRSDTTGGD
jgi:hypothetical protein